MIIILIAILIYFFIKINNKSINTLPLPKVKSTYIIPEQPKQEKKKTSIISSFLIPKKPLHNNEPIAYMWKQNLKKW